ncbi:TraB/GumN family protein [Noviluteimonas gilva]|uniref:TraB/GumN family protein n=1 Tax=Noviluteimonas gilva TaxID=2682097 RepID=A0A7C9LHQ3_9GAMM|nr:TraB/GumN family protein [Lysobacter gilvus]MUV15081.1 TraB/GumN family protein [Lysobacter gilvus]
MRRLLLAAATLAIAIPLFASDASAPKSTGAPVPLLWKVSDKDNTVYLLGSFHMLTKDDYPLSKDVDAAYADAEEVVFELAPEEMLSKDLGMAMGQAAIRTDGTTLNDELPPAQRARLAQWLQDNEATLRQMGVQPAMFQMVDAWYASLLVTIAEARAAGFDSELGLDAHLGKQATADGKRTSGLEGGMKQLAMFENMDRQVQLQLMAESFDETDGGKAALERLHAQWRSGDVDQLWKKLGVEFRDEYPALYKTINSDRNAAWVPLLRKRLDTPGTDDTLVVVGALHLLGKDGVVERMKAQGYTVERVCSACAKR